MKSTERVSTCLVAAVDRALRVADPTKVLVIRMTLCSSQAFNQHQVISSFNSQLVE